VRYELLGADGAEALAPQVWSVYEATFGDDRDGGWLETTWQRHLGRDDFRLATARDADVLVGFGYGYTGHRGEYWPDRVVEALPPAVTDAWVGGHFELVELAVLDQNRGQGAGRRLHDLLLAGLPHERALLSTEDSDTPAVRLYRSCGWERLGLYSAGVLVTGKRLR
jgi:ribosomal protein S18 acetylase RimI-like enzyme